MGFQVGLFIVVLAPLVYAEEKELSGVGITVVMCYVVIMLRHIG